MFIVNGLPSVEKDLVEVKLQLCLETTNKASEKQQSEGVGIPEEWRMQKSKESRLSRRKEKLCRSNQQGISAGYD